MKSFAAILAVLTFTSTAKANTQDVKYVIEGQEASDIYAGLLKEKKAWTDSNGNRTVVYVHYEYPGDANIRIRTQVTCTPAPSTCTVSGYHLTFIPYKSR